MKVEKEKTVNFKLELNPLEFLVIKSFVGSVNGSSDFRKLCDDIYNTLDKVSEDCDTGLLEQVINGDVVDLNHYKKEAEKL